ncbi:MAG: acyl carrier protein [Actinobacteria bacterium RBG_13_35_12]|jgi:acyl carrier protein|nr:MAG: acyl carrier protein [Actinobacteria bacterium RBG_13_35_12]
MENFDKLKEVLIDVLGAKEEDIKTESKFVDDLGADSLDLVELIMAFEDKFGIEINDEDAEKIITVEDALEYINAHSKK